MNSIGHFLICLTNVFVKFFRCRIGTGNNVDYRFWEKKQEVSSIDEDSLGGENPLNIPYMMTFQAAGRPLSKASFLIQRSTG